MNKTPISILQEVMVQKRKPVPEYIIEDCSNAHGVQFRCIVTFDCQHTSGYGQTKKEAKQNSAKKALDLMNLRHNVKIEKEELIVALPTHTQPIIKYNIQFINFVGKLNEYASSNGLCYPNYIDNVEPLNGTFEVQCEFLNFKTEGVGLKKKDAKQDSARKMLEMIRTGNTSVTLLMKEMKISNNIELENTKKQSQEVLNRYEAMFPNVKDPITHTVEINPIPNLKNNTRTLEELKQILEKYDYIYNIKIYQTKPYIMMMKINNSTATIMGKGNTREEALLDLYEMAVDMFSHGFTLPLL